MNKDFEYRGYVFTITVNLNTRIERCLGGKHWHTVVTTCGKLNYHVTELVLENELKTYVEESEITIHKYIDDEIDGELPVYHEYLSNNDFK